MHNELRHVGPGPSGHCDHFTMAEKLGLCKNCEERG